MGEQVNYMNSVEKNFLEMDAARARFSGASRQVYMDVASRGLIMDSAFDLAQRHIKERVDGVVEKKKYFALVESAREKLASLLSADSAEVAITKNVSEGLNIVAGAMDWAQGGEVILCSGIEHPNNIYTWRNLESRGVRVIDLPHDGGAFPTQTALAWLAKPCRGARVLTLSATSFKPGFRAELQVLAEACDRVGALLVVDGAQSAGVTHLDVRSTPVGALALSTQKGLCALYGMGFLYVRRDWANRMRPQSLARFGVEISGQHEADYDSGAIHFRDAALRFDLGNYNFLAAALVCESLDLLLQYGTQRIDAHVTGLARRLVEGLADVGARVWRHPSLTPSNIVCVDLSGDAGRAVQVQQALKSRNVAVAVRAGLLRYSLHLYNSVGDVDKAVEATGSALAAC